MRQLKKAARTATAYHEAGHAVAAFVQGLEVHGVSIVRTPMMHGVVKYQNPLHDVHLDYDASDKARLCAEREAIVSLAGPTAHRRYAPRSWRNYHGQADFERAADTAMAINRSGEAANAHLKWLHIQTKDLIETHWDLVEALAQALIRENELKAEQVREILQASGRKSNVVPLVRA